MPGVATCHSRFIATRFPARMVGAAPGDSLGLRRLVRVGVITHYNDQAAELWGRRPAPGDTDQRFCGSHMLYRVDGQFLPRDQSPMADVLAGKVPGVYDAEVCIQRPDGSRVNVIVNAAPLCDGSGVIVGAVNSFRENRRPQRLR